jgi:coenzyme F420-reducing hydrogenase alpha subunit
MSDRQNIEVPALARVEGEGAIYIRLKNGEIAEVQVNIYEPPRFFEGFLQGRYFQEVPDITARICGICPVAYQMSSVQALESAMDVAITPQIRDLRRLLYCAEYIESHALHVYMLQGPDMLGHESAITLAAAAPDVVKKALKLKKIGNDLLRAIGGRSVHPVNSCVGGFYRWPQKEAIHGLLEDLKWALQASKETVEFATGLAYPEFEMDYEFVALTQPTEYAIYDGKVLSSRMDETEEPIPAAEYERHYLEAHVAHSNALHSHTSAGTPYFVGPLARLNLNHAQLRPAAQLALEGTGLEFPVHNPFKGLIARAVELVEVCDQAIELIEKYDPTGFSHVPFKVKPGEGSGVSEAPRGLIYHRYVVDDHGMIRFARIVPPTAQNFAQMEADLWKYAPKVLDLPHDEATLACEHLIRTYDPCISCATHFLTLTVDKG